MWLFSRKGASGFSATSTAEEVTEGIDGSGLTAIVTGASSGIGAETARVLALRGVNVIMAVRNLSAGNEAKVAIVREIPNAKVNAMELDLSSTASIQKFASNFNSLDLPLNVLVNNAGVMATPFMLSKDNIEMQFATNHVGHFLLTNLMMETMKKTARESSREGRIVNVSSRRHKFSYPEGIHFNKINDQSGYSSLSAYGQSKLANVLHANELARRLKEEKVEITANSLHPGGIATNLFRHHSFVNGLINALGKHVMKNVQQGAATTCYVALHPDIKGMTGKYYADSNLAETSLQAKDQELAKKLWDFTQNLIDQFALPYLLFDDASKISWSKISPSKLPSGDAIVMAFFIPINRGSLDELCDKKTCFILQQCGGLSLKRKDSNQEVSSTSQESCEVAETHGQPIPTVH